MLVGGAGTYVWLTSCAAPPHDLPAALDALAHVLRADQLSVRAADIDAHVSSWSYDEAHPHAAVVYPESTADVSAAVAICARFDVPLTPYAGGTSLESQTSAPVPAEDDRRSICLDMGRMRRVLRLSVDDADVTVQPGIGWEELNAHLRDEGTGLFFPMDPGPTARIGGMASTSCSGTNAVHFGTMNGPYVLSLEVVLPDGQAIQTRSRARKSAAGPDLTKLFIGSEGTMGIITAATLRLAPVLPNAVAVASFESIDAACAAGNALLAAGVTPQCLELVDTEFASAINRAMAADPNESRRMPEKPSLFIKFVGASAAHLKADWNVAGALLKQRGGHGLRFVDQKDQIDSLWSMRKLALMYVQQYPLSPFEGDNDEDKGDWRFVGTDVCVPLKELPMLIARAKATFKEQEIYAPILGHVGDGNFHAGLMWREEDHEKEARVRAMLSHLVHVAQELGGTCTGEHGVGLGKREFLPAELGNGTVDLIRRIKTLLDPLNILNPGKLLPPADSS